MKTAITAADMLNDKIFPFFEDQELPMLRILTNRGSGKVENHDDERYLVINNIEYAKRRSNIRKPMSSASVSTKQFCRSFIRLPLESEFIRIQRHCKQTQRNGCYIITIIVPIKVKCIVEEHRWKHYLMKNAFRQKRI